LPEARGERRRERASEAPPGSSSGYTVKRDEPPFLHGGRAGSVASVFEIYRGQSVPGKRNNFDIRYAIKDAIRHASTRVPARK